jgi:RHS repeat-associated protein
MVVDKTMDVKELIMNQKLSPWIIKMMKPKLSLAWITLLLVLLVPFSAQAVQQVSSSPSVGDAIYNETNIDLRIKVPGGFLDIKRFFGRISFKGEDTAHGWSWNRRWINLSVGEVSEDLGVARTLTRGAFEYTLDAGFKTGSNAKPTYSYEHLANKKITQTDTGYRWSDRNGDWIDYNQQGYVVAYGDRFGNEYTLVRDTSDASLIQQVLDRHQNVLVTFTYNDNGIEQVEDYSGRKVKYVWESNLLKEVIDELKNTWKYTYELVNSHQLIASITDPEGQKIEFENKVVGGGTVTICSGTDPDDDPEEPGYGGGSPAPRSTPASSCRSVPAASQAMLISKTDAEGTKYTYKYEYGRDKRYTRTEKNSEGSNIVTTFDTDGTTALVLNDGQPVYQKLSGENREAISKASGHQTFNTLDKWKQTIRRDHPDGTVEKWKYHPSFDVVTQYTDKRGTVTFNEYNDNGALIRNTAAYGLPEAQIIEYEYNQQGLITLVRYVGDEKTETTEITSKFDDFGNIIEYIDSEGNKTEYLEYDASGNYHKLKDAKGNSWIYDYDLSGNLKSIKTPLGHTSIFEFDKKSRLVKQTLAGKKPTLIGYNKRDQRTRITSPVSTPEALVVNAMSYRVDGKPLTTIDAEGRVQSFDYGIQGKLIQGYDGEGNKIKFEYDYDDNSGGQLASAINYPTYRMEYRYDIMGRVVRTKAIDTQSENGKAYQVRYGYNENGNIVSVTDNKGNKTTSEYDVLNRLITETDAMGGVTKFEYDARNNLLTVTDPELSSTRYQFNKNNQTVLETKPLGQTLAYSYSSLGQQVTQTDSLGQIAKYIYDNNGRQTATEFYINAQAMNVGTDSAQKTINYNYDQAGWLKSYSDGQTSSLYNYDDAGRLLNETVNFGAFSKTLAYTYFKNGKRKTYTNADNKTYHYQYDQANRFTSLTLPDNKRISVNEHQWQVPKKVSFPGGSQMTLNRDGLNKLTSLSVLDSAKNTILKHQYTYDEVGNIESQQTHFDSFDYGYDDLYRLKSATSGKTQEAYSYDKVGNRLTSHKNNDSWGYDENHQLNSIGSTSYQYNDNGSMTHRSFTLPNQTASIEQEFVYGIDGRLEQVKNLAGESSVEKVVAHYTYDPFGRRLSKTVFDVNSDNSGASKTTYFLYSAQGLMAEYDEQGNAISNYNYWPGASWGSKPLYLEQLKDGTSQHYFYHNDHLGTPQALSDTQGKIVWRAELSSFGEATFHLNQIENSLRFAGQYYDAETGLHYNYFRYYDPMQGRYISSDPIGLWGGLNRFGYAKGNPLYNVDYYGLYCLTGEEINAIAGGIGGAVSGAISGAIVGGAAAGPIGAVIGGIIGAVRGGGVGIGSASIAGEIGGGAAASGMAGGAVGDAGSGRGRGALSGMVGGMAGDAAGGGLAGGALAGAVGGAAGGGNVVSGVIGGAIGGAAAVLIGLGNGR